MVLGPGFRFPGCSFPRTGQDSLNTQGCHQFCVFSESQHQLLAILLTRKDIRTMVCFHSDRRGRMESIFTHEELWKSLRKEAINCLKQLELTTGM